MTAPRLYYLASPYTHKNRQVVNRRVAAVQNVAYTLAAKGLFVYSPVVHGHALEEKREPIPYKYWIEHGLEMLSRSSAMIVVCLDGWGESRGVQLEIGHALKLDIPVLYYHPTHNNFLDSTGNTHDPR